MDGVGDYDCGTDAIFPPLRAELNALAFAVVVACLVDVVDDDAHGWGEKASISGLGDRWSRSDGLDDSISGDFEDNCIV